MPEFPPGWRRYHRLAADSTAWSRMGTIVLHYRFAAFQPKIAPRWPVGVALAGPARRSTALPSPQDQVTTHEHTISQARTLPPPHPRSPTRLVDLVTA